MKQWLLFEMSKNSLEEKPTEAPPKGTRMGASGCRGPLELLKLGIHHFQGKLAQLPTLSAHCLFLPGLSGFRTPDMLFVGLFFHTHTQSIETFCFSVLSKTNSKHTRQKS